MTRPPNRSDDGAAAVEFALVVPILLALVFGIIVFGIIFASQISLNTTARDAARAGVVQPLSPATPLSCRQILDRVRSSTSTLWMSGQRINVTVTGPTGMSCSVSAGPPPSYTPLYSGATATTDHPCQASTGSSAQLVIKSTYPFQSPGGFIGPNSLTLQATGQFQCEYT